MDDFVHQLMIRTSVGGKVAYMNNTDYYSEKTLVRPDRIAFYAKKQGFDPDLVLEQVYFVAAYNEFRQEKAVFFRETDRVKEVSRAARKVYGYFNDHFHGFAIESSSTASRITQILKVLSN